MKDNRYYVYQLIDPRDKKILYVGKGTGGRCYAHFTITAKHRKLKNKLNTDLFLVLEDILDNTNYSQFDCVNIVKSRVSDKEARKLELELIHKIGYINLHNASTKAEWMIGSKWMNNGIIDRQFLIDEKIPKDFCFKGRIKNQKWQGKNKGKVWVTNGEKNKMIIFPLSGILEHGWRLGYTSNRVGIVPWNKGLKKTIKMYN